MLHFIFGTSFFAVSLYKLKTYTFTVSENLILHLSLFLSVGLISLL